LKFEVGIWDFEFNSFKMFTFRKEERLCSNKIIGDLFSEGRSVHVNQFRIFWKLSDHSTGYPARVAISVPVKHIKKANKRNLVKRRIREAYRKNKHLLYDQLKKRNMRIAFVICYFSNEIEDYNNIESKIVISLQSLIRDLEKNS